MDIYLKAICGGLVALILCLTISDRGKELSLLLTLTTCCMILSVLTVFLTPVMEFFMELESLIPLESDLLGTLLKIIGIGILGELCGTICSDSGNSALSKTISMLTTMVMLWLSLPLLETLLALIRQILENI